jgi:hypothetical protein
MTFDWIAFLTDYGHSDGFVAACHGVIARIAPEARIIDVTHDIPPQDIRRGAVVLAQTLPYLPPCVVVGVVDPTVGTPRRAIALVAGEYVLIGPDNGLLSWAADACGGVTRAVEVTFRIGAGAPTFDGRDVFAPAAAQTAVGASLSSLGLDVAPETIVRLPPPWVSAQPGLVEAEILTIDHFGNVTLAASEDDLSIAGICQGDQVRLMIGDRWWRVPVGRTFASVQPGQLVVVVDSAGHVAVAVNQESAAMTLAVKSGDRATIAAI